MDDPFDEGCGECEACEARIKLVQLCKAVATSSYALESAKRDGNESEFSKVLDLQDKAMSKLGLHFRNQSVRTFYRNPSIIVEMITFFATCNDINDVDKMFSDQEEEPVQEPEIFKAVRDMFDG